MDELQTRQKQLLAACSELGLQEDVQLIEVKNNRWILGYVQSPSHPEFAWHMIKLERLLKTRTGNFDIELLSETIEDRNKRFSRTGRGFEVINLESARGIDSLD